MGKIVTELEEAHIVVRQVDSGRINIYCSNEEEVQRAEEILANNNAEGTKINAENGATKIEVK